MLVILEPPSKNKISDKRIRPSSFRRGAVHTEKLRCNRRWGEVNVRSRGRVFCIACALSGGSFPPTLKLRRAMRSAPAACTGFAPDDAVKKESAALMPRSGRRVLKRVRGSFSPRVPPAAPLPMNPPFDKLRDRPSTSSGQFLPCASPTVKHYALSRPLLKACLPVRKPARGQAGEGQYTSLDNAP